MASLPSAVLFPFGTLITNIPHLLSRMLQFRLCGIGLPPFSRNLATCRAMRGALGNLRLALSIGNKDRRWARGETSCFTAVVWDPCPCHRKELALSSGFS